MLNVIILIVIMFSILLRVSVCHRQLSLAVFGYAQCH
jgi:hypothetical protein